MYIVHHSLFLGSKITINITLVERNCSHLLGLVAFANSFPLAFWSDQGGCRLFFSHFFFPPRISLHFLFYFFSPKFLFSFFLQWGKTCCQHQGSKTFHGRRMLCLFFFFHFSFPELGVSVWIGKILGPTLFFLSFLGLFLFMLLWAPGHNDLTVLCLGQLSVHLH